MEAAYWDPTSIGILSGAFGANDTFTFLAVSPGVNFWFDTALEGWFAGASLDVGYVGLGTQGAEVTATSLGATGRIGHRWIWGSFSLAPIFTVGFATVTVDLADEGFDDTFQDQLTGLDYGFGVPLSIAF